MTTTVKVYLPLLTLSLGVVQVRGLWQDESRARARSWKQTPRMKRLDWKPLPRPKPENWITEKP